MNITFATQIDYNWNRNGTLMDHKWNIWMNGISMYNYKTLLVLDCLQTGSTTLGSSSVKKAGIKPVNLGKTLRQKPQIPIHSKGQNKSI